VRRLIGGGAGVVFKGTGFYQTDYRSNAYKEQKRKESGEPAKPKGEGGERGKKKERESGS